jgi:hypothetical protein
MSSQQRILVVANRTADSPGLVAALGRRAGAGHSRFTLLVPAVPYGFSWAANMKAGWPRAVALAERGTERMRQAGLDVDGAIVGDPDPFAAVGDALHVRGFDEVVIATLPPGISRWLRLSLPNRLRRATALPVTHLTVHPQLRRRGACARAVIGASL